MEAGISETDSLTRIVIVGEVGGVSGATEPGSKEDKANVESTRPN
jgi:hypothetical protein